MNVAIVSAIYGGFDHPKPPLPQTVPCRWVLVSDDPTPVDGWEKIHAPSTHHPRVAAKLPKLFPWEYAGPADYYIWLDGSFQVTSPTFVEEVVALGPTFAQFGHPDRLCIYEEALVSLGMEKYRKQGDVAGQVAAYRADGMPAGFGLWATGLIVRRGGMRVANHSAAWWDEIERWSYQDQVSEPFVSWKQDMRPEILPHALWANPWVTWHSHAAGD